jgi:hypothetical protein
MNSKLKKYEDELLDYLRTDKDKTTKIKLYKSSKYPDDIIRIKTEKDISPGYNRFSIELIRKSKSPEIISNIYEYKGKESKAFKNMTLEQLIKGTKHTYLSNYLGSIKYNNISPKTSPSPTLEERIDNLPEDMKGEIKKQLMHLKLSPGSKNTRSEINKEFRNGFSYIKRLKQLRESYGDKVESLDTMKEINKKVVDILGDITIKKLDTLGNTYVKDYIISMRILDSIRKIPNESDRLYDELIEKEKNLGLIKFDSYDKAKKNYLRKNPGATNFDKKVKSWEDQWNSDHNMSLHFGDIQAVMKQFKDEMIYYDPKTKEETKQKIDSFLKLKEETITYKEYIDKMQKLPLSVKVVMRAKF